MLTVVIQAGGESRRMGQDKGLIPFLGAPLIERVILRLASVSDDLIVVTNHPERYQFLGKKLVSDVMPGRGALGGLYTALVHAQTSLVAAVACDMPFANPRLLAAERERLLETGSDAVVPDTGEGLEPFHAIYRRETCLPMVKEALEQDRWRVDSWFQMAKIYYMGMSEIARYDPRILAFRNVNTRADLKQAEQTAEKNEENHLQSGDPPAGGESDVHSGPV